jgi:hypothetical protein
MQTSFPLFAKEEEKSKVGTFNSTFPYCKIQIDKKTER